jgi:diaminopimelate decarboxylase
MADGHKLHHIDLGGGLGVPYRTDNEPPPDPEAYAAIIKRHTSDLGLKLVFEMGRLIAGNAGILVTQVIYVKQGADRSFVIVDAAMNDLIRPTLYDAFHDIKPVEEPGPHTPRLVADVVGPVCETGDYLALARDLPMVKPGDLIAVMTTGAYGAVTANTYNTRLLIPEVLVKNEGHAVIRPRPSYDDLIELDQMPAWLS